VRQGIAGRPLCVAVIAAGGTPHGAQTQMLKCWDAYEVARSLGSWKTTSMVRLTMYEIAVEVLVSGCWHHRVPTIVSPGLAEDVPRKEESDRMAPRLKYSATETLPAKGRTTVVLEEKPSCEPSSQRDPPTVGVVESSETYQPTTGVLREETASMAHVHFVTTLWL
jgi:hypothetical protein